MRGINPIARAYNPAGEHRRYRDKHYEGKDFNHILKESITMEKPICKISHIIDRHTLRAAVKEALDKAGLKAEGLLWAEITMSMTRAEILAEAHYYIEAS